LMNRSAAGGINRRGGKYNFVQEFKKTGSLSNG